MGQNTYIEKIINKIDKHLAGFGPMPSVNEIAKAFGTTAEEAEANCKTQGHKQWMKDMHEKDIKRIKKLESSGVVFLPPLSVPKK